MVCLPAATLATIASSSWRKTSPSPGIISNCGAEFYEARFEVPLIGNADTFAYYLEAKYKFTPQFFGALRWNQQLFGTVRDEDHRSQWGNDIWRIDAALGYRFTDYLQAKLQYSFSREETLRNGENLIATQITLKF